MSLSHRRFQFLAIFVLLLTAPGLVSVTWGATAFATTDVEVVSDSEASGDDNQGEPGTEDDSAGPAGDETRQDEEETAPPVEGDNNVDVDSGNTDGPVSGEDSHTSDDDIRDDTEHNTGGEVDEENETADDSLQQKPLPGFTPFILWGQNASIQQAPWQVALLRTDRSNEFQAQFCGGTIISPVWIVTAAHCLDNYSASDIRVLAGQATLSTSISPVSFRSVAVAQIFQHPAWIDIDLGYDVGLIQLAQPLALNGSTIASVAYAPQSPRSGTRAVVTGWGASNIDFFDYIFFGWVNVSFPTNLQLAQSVVLTDRQCRDFWGITVTNQGFCGDPPRQQSGYPCYGDSGGPFVSTVSNQRLLYGIVSAGSAGCFDAPTIYQDVAKVSGWIAQQTGIAPGLQQASVSVTANTRPVQGGTNVRLGIRGGTGRGGASFQPHGDFTGCTLTQQGRNWVLSSTQLTQCQVVGTKAGEGLFAAATTAPITVSFTIPRKQSSLSITNNRASATGSVGSALTVSTRGGSVPGGSTSVEVLSGPCRVVSGQPMQVITDSAGVCRVQARMAGAGNFGDVVSRPVNLSFRGPQSPLFVSNATTGIAATTSVRLATTGGSGSGRVSYQVQSGNCRVSGNTLRALSGSTTCSVTATKAASGVFDSVTSATASFGFTPAAQRSVSVSGPSRPVVAGSTVKLGLRGGSGRGAVSFELASPNANCQLAVDRGRWTIRSTDLTSCQIQGVKAAEGLFAEARTPVFTVNFTVPARQRAVKITNSRSSLRSTPGEPIVLNWTGGSVPNGTVVVNVIDGASCSLVGAQQPKIVSSAPTSCRVSVTIRGEGIFGDVTSKPVKLEFR